MAFIGPKEIESISVSELKTPIGSEISKVTFKDGTSDVYPTSLLNDIQTEEAIDLTQLRNKWVDPIINRTIVLMQEADMKIEDLTYFVDVLLSSLDNKINTSNAKLFNVDFYPQRRLLQIENILNTNAKPTEPEVCEVAATE